MLCQPVIVVGAFIKKQNCEKCHFTNVIKHFIHIHISPSSTLTEAVHATCNEEVECSDGNINGSCDISEKYMVHETSSVLVGTKLIPVFQKLHI